MREYTGLSGQPHEVAFVPGDPPRLAAAANTAAYVWPADGGDPTVLSWDETAWGEPFLAVSPDGRLLVAGPPAYPRGWDLAAGRPRDLNRRDHLAVGFARDCLLHIRRVVTRRRFHLLAERRSAATLARVGDRLPLPLPADLVEPVRSMNSAGHRETTALSADGTRFALTPGTPPAEEAVHVWNTVEGSTVGALPVRRFPCAISLSPDGSRLAVDAGTTVYVHDGTTLDLVAKWKTKYSYRPRLAWSPDGRRLARTDRSTTVRVFDPATGREELALGAKRGALVSAAFSPDGLTLATGTSDGSVRVWDVG